MEGSSILQLRINAQFIERSHPQVRHGVAFQRKLIPTKIKSAPQKFASL